MSIQPQQQQQQQASHSNPMLAATSLESSDGSYSVHADFMTPLDVQMASVAGWGDTPSMDPELSDIIEQVIDMDERYESDSMIFGELTSATPPPVTIQPVMSIVQSSQSVTSVTQTTAVVGPSGPLLQMDMSKEKLAITAIQKSLMSYEKISPVAQTLSIGGGLSHNASSCGATTGSIRQQPCREDNTTTSSLHSTVPSALIHHHPPPQSSNPSTPSSSNSYPSSHPNSPGYHLGMGNAGQPYQQQQQQGGGAGGNRGNASSAAAASVYSAKVLAFQQGSVGGPVQGGGRNDGGPPGMASEYVRKELKAVVGARTIQRGLSGPVVNHASGQMNHSSPPMMVPGGKPLNQADLEALGLSYELPQGNDGLHGRVWDSPNMGESPSQTMPSTRNTMEEAPRPADPQMSLLKQLLSE
ncbi:hypothetical protein DAPPUDRAFT_324493 [Daphnia pulex]|uniref:Uncharacterized protein n=1 Tax=Daphnia pulex TaxID=6669 RepID=E9H1W3_DAPPU|nr:hypothetical protein DAPPUDRAFT_324493 [Daphnia pulex]|eukprot:EFX74244.1 hypothetical protein DAPPUDRAFT_324493 [Daphnia pulex]